MAIVVDEHGGTAGSSLEDLLGRSWEITDEYDVEGQGRASARQVAAGSGRCPIDDLSELDMELPEMGRSVASSSTSSDTSR
jgi:Mg2+/Co2+ transporter CorC